MGSGSGIDALDRVRPLLVSLATEAPRRFSGLHYADIRLQAVEARGAVAENGSPKAGFEEVTYALGIRVIAGRKLRAPGYYGAYLGEADLAGKPVELAMPGRLVQLTLEADRVLVY